MDAKNTKTVEVKFLVLSLLVIVVILFADRPLIASAKTSVASASIPKQAEVKFEAEDAYLTGGAHIDANHFGYSGGGYVDNYIKVGAAALFTVNVPSDGAYLVTLEYANGTGMMKTLSIYANGLKLQQIALPPTASWNIWASKTENLSLRAGVNTLSYQYDSGDSGNVSLDFIRVTNGRPMASRGATLSYIKYQAENAATNGRPMASRGATLSYIEYQAENAATNGTVIGPDRTFTQLASEASGRKAVQLKARGQYVEFTLTQPANAMTIRYSIPDTENGTGLTVPLSLYINKTHKQNLTLTSKYNWFYGSYPFSNNPGDGKAHHFYDETRVMLGGLPAGAKVRLQIDAGDTAPWYIIDLADFYHVSAPYTEPPGYISITDDGADPSGATDSTQAVNKAVAAAESQGKGVWIPAGTFTITSHIIVNNVMMRGAGPWYSVLHGNGGGVYGNASPHPSQNVKLYDFAIFGEVMNRDDGAQVNGIGGALGGGSVIQDIWIEHTKVGMWFDGPFSDLLIVGDTIRDVTADGINLHDGITNTVVEQTQVRNSGDDGLAMWAEKTADQNNVFRFNTVELPILANNIAIYGGANNSVTDNIVSDTLTQGGGIHVGNRFNAVPLSGTTTIARNTLVRTGVLDPNWQFGVGAMWFYALDSAMTGKINVVNDEIDDSSYEAIHFIGSTITNVTFNHVNINTAGTFAIQEQAAGSAQFSYVTARNLVAGGQYNCGVNFAITKGPGNIGWSSTHCGFPIGSMKAALGGH
jgi:hypothetical protein